MPSTKQLDHLNAVIDHIIRKKGQLGREINIRIGPPTFCEKLFLEDCENNIRILEAQRHELKTKL